jgi:hypothetical protein
MAAGQEFELAVGGGGESAALSQGVSEKLDRRDLVTEVVHRRAMVVGK